MVLKETHAYQSPILSNFYLVSLKWGKDISNFYTVFLKHKSAQNSCFADVNRAKSMSLNLGPLESRIWSRVQSQDVEVMNKCHSLKHSMSACWVLHHRVPQSNTKGEWAGMFDEQERILQKVCKEALYFGVVRRIEKWREIHLPGFSLSPFFY